MLRAAINLQYDRPILSYILIAFNNYFGEERRQSPIGHATKDAVDQFNFHCVRRGQCKEIWGDSVREQSTF